MNMILSAVVGATLALSAVHASAQTRPAEKQVALAIQSETLADALMQWAEQTGFKLMSPHMELARQLPAPRLQGMYSAQHSLEALLAGTPFTYAWVAEGAVTITAARPRKSRPRTSKVAPLTAAYERVAASSDASAQGIVRPRGAASSEVGRILDDLGEVVVTGSYIPGSAGASPVHVYDSKDIERSGYPTLQQFIRSIPQNFGGGASELASVAHSDPSSVSIPGDNAANLRGLGPGATLTLVNGRRMASAGTGAYVDLSLIPLSAIERVEVMTDGASALYGSDAVAGVINFILKDDFQGAETLADHAVVSEGSYTSTRLSQLLGRNWNGGNVMLAYDHTEQSNLNGADRSFAPTATAARDLTPRTNRNSVLASADVAITDSLGLHAMGLYADAQVQATNVLGAASSNDAENAYGSAALTYELSPAWSVELAADWGRYRIGEIGRVGSVVALNRLTETKQASADALLRGEILSLPAGAIGLAVGIGYREEDFEQRDRSTGSTIVSGDRDVESMFSEVNVPLFSAQNRRTFLEELTLSLAARSERYSDFGDTTNPKFGVRWRPHDDLLLRATTGESFRAPTLFMAGSSSQAVVFPLQDPSSVPPSTVSLILLGASPDLDPETADAKSFGFDYAPSLLPGGRMSLTWFETEYTARIQAPATTFLTMLVNEPAFADFVVRNPSTAQVNDAITAADQFLNPIGLPLGAVRAIVDDRVQNVASVEASGFEFEASYAFDTRVGRAEARLGGQYLSEFKLRPTSTSPELDLADTIFNPPRLRGLATLVWSTSALTTALTVNHTNDYKNTAVVPTGQVDALTTVDLHASYLFGSKGPAWLAGFQIGVNVMDVFDSSPSEAPGTLAGYDATNASPLGRVISAQLRKRW
jgi:iron complex outermembrane recepter protein